MTSLKSFVPLAAGLLLTACAYPVSTADQGAQASALYFKGAPAGARVLVDGADAGEALTFDGKKTVLTVKPGSHKVVVSAGGSALYDKSIYVEAGSRVGIEIR